MAAIDPIESSRLTVQHRLDSAKTQAERNKLGQFATPTDLATDILQHARKMLPLGTPIRFLDPAFGTGSFYSALTRVFPPHEIKDALGYEIDSAVVREAREIWHDSPLQLKRGDFTRTLPPLDEGGKANLLICNPPYVRHHHLSPKEKQRLQATAKLLAEVNLSGLSGLHCYFLCLSVAWLAKDSLAGWLIPSEFMDVNYGRQIKSFLLNRVTLLRIHRFRPEDVQFSEALVSSAVVWFRNTPPQYQQSVEFSYGGTLARPEVSKQVTADVLRDAAKWTRYPLRHKERKKGQSDKRLSDLFSVKRGLATGANDFFVLTPEQVTTHHIPAKFLTPIFPSSRFLPADEIGADENGEPILERKLYLLTCDLPEEKVKTDYPSLWSYFEAGIARGIHERYLCRSRSPWYAQEKRPPSPLLCTYMGRQNVGRGKPFRFILNHSKATAANVYLMLYPKPTLQAHLEFKPDIIKSIWSELNKLSSTDLTSEGRVYGGGLHKLEPKELGNVILDASLLIDI